MATGSRSLSDAIKHDHQEIFHYYDKYVESIGNVDAQERWSNQLIWEVARHSVGEELIVYPLMEEKLTDGRRLADQDRADHLKVKKNLYELEGMKVGSEKFNALLKSTVEELREHINSEETEDLPQLETAIGQEVSKQVAAKFARTKKFVPTRSHPSAPDKPPFETVAGLMAAPIDKLKDMFAKFPTEEMKH